MFSSRLFEILLARYLKEGDLRKLENMQKIEIYQRLAKYICISWSENNQASVLNEPL